MNISINCRDLLAQMLFKNPDQRISWSQLAKHPWVLGSADIIPMKPIKPKATRAESVPIAIYGFGGPPIPIPMKSVDEIAIDSNSFQEKSRKGIMIGNIPFDETYSHLDGSSIEYSQESATRAISCPATLQTNNSTILNTSLRVLRGVFNIF